MKFNLCLLLFMFSFLKASIAQIDCFTGVDEVKAHQAEALLKLGMNKNVDKNYTGENPTIRLAIHNVKRSDGTGGIPWNEIDDLISMLPSVFSTHNICFTTIYKGDIFNNTYYNISRYNGMKIENNLIYQSMIDDSEYRINNANRIDNAINIYFVAPFENGVASGPAGPGAVYTSFPTVVMGAGSYSNSVNPNNPRYYSSFMNNLGILAHELGHCLGLYHTHHTHTIEDDIGATITVYEFIKRPPVNDPNNELKDSTINCERAGDKLCDTPADPILTNPLGGQVYDETTCRYIANKKINNVPYVPDERNLMSFAAIYCREHFTIGQGNRMRNFILNTNLYDDYVIRENVTLTGTLSSNRYYGTENSITSSVEHTSGEVIYQASNEIKLQNGFKLTADANTSFHAKLGTYSCGEPLVTNHGKITKGNNSDIPTEDAVFDFKMYPNPTEAIFTMDLFFVEDEAVTITITDIMGKVYLVQNRTLTGDTNHKFEVNVALFGKGIYFVNVRTAKHFKTRKLVVE